MKLDQDRESQKTIHSGLLLIEGEEQGSMVKTLYGLGIQGQKRAESWGTWVGHSTRHPTLAQIMISRIVGLSPATGSGLTARSLGPASDSVSPSLLPLRHSCCVCLSLSKINKH